MHMYVIRVSVLLVINNCQLEPAYLLLALSQMVLLWHYYSVYWLLSVLSYCHSYKHHAELYRTRHIDSVVRCYHIYTLIDRWDLAIGDEFNAEIEVGIPHDHM